MFDWDVWCFLFCVLPKPICYGSFVKFWGDWKSVGQREKSGGRLRSNYFKMFSAGNCKFLISPGFCLCFLVFLIFYIIFFLYFKFIVSFLCFPIANGIIINVALLIMLKLVFLIFSSVVRVPCDWNWYYVDILSIPGFVALCCLSKRLYSYFSQI